MKVLITLILYLMFYNSFSQESLVFGNIEFNENMRLIGMYPHYDKDKTFEKYNFIIEDLKELDSISKFIQKGKYVMNQVTENEFVIRLFEGDKIIQTWSLGPKYSYIRTNKKSYEFFTIQILDLAKKYGFKYKYFKKSYKDKIQFDKDYKIMKSDSNFLFVYKPNFKFAGSFEVKFYKSEEFNNPKAIYHYLIKKIGKLKKEEVYHIYFAASDYNRKNRNQYTMTIESDFELYEWFNDNNGEKKEWILNDFSATIFVKD